MVRIHPHLGIAGKERVPREGSIDNRLGKQLVSDVHRHHVGDAEVLQTLDPASLLLATNQLGCLCPKLDCLPLTVVVVGGAETSNSRLCDDSFEEASRLGGDEVVGR